MYPSSPSSTRARSQSAAKAKLKKKEIQAVEDLTTLPAGELPVYKPPTKKRKIASAPPLENEQKQKKKGKGKGKGNVGACDRDDAVSSAKKTKEDPPIPAMKEEKRLRLFRKKAPLTYMTKLERATSQRWVGIAIATVR